MNGTDFEVDFGLAPGESFEPDPLPDEFDLSQPHIQTVLGPIEPAALGMTFFARGYAGIDGQSSPEPIAVIAELEAAHAIGLRALALMPPDSASIDLAAVSWIAARSPVHVVVLDQGDRRRGSISWSGDSASAEYEIISTAGNSQCHAGRLLLGIEPETEQSLTGTLHALPLALMEQGFTAQQVRNMLVDHPMAALTTSAGELP